MATIICQHCQLPNEIPDEELLQEAGVSQEDMEALENLKDYWKHQQCGAEQ